MRKIDNTKLTYCDLGIAYQCNFQCKMCKFWEKSPLNQDNILSIEQWKNVLEQLSETVDKQNCIINLSGPGEPLLRNNIFDLIKHGINLGLKIQIISNGFCVNEQIASDIAASGLKFISFSLDSLNYQIHDYLRGKDKALEYVMQAIKNISLACPDICIGINTVISRINIDSLVALTCWAEEDKRIKYINFQAIAQPFSFTEPADLKWFMTEKYKFLWPDNKKQLEITLNSLVELKNRGFKIANKPGQLRAFLRYFLEPLSFIRDNRCNLGQARILNIDPAGNVSKCQMTGIIGNIAEGKTLQQICASDKCAEHIEMINQCRRNCHLVVSCYYDKE